MVYIWTHGTDMHSWYWQRLMVYTWTHGIDKTHGIDLDTWYSIGTPESHMYERAESFPNAGCFCCWKLYCKNGLVNLVCLTTKNESFMSLSAKDYVTKQELLISPRPVIWRNTRTYLPWGREYVDKSNLPGLSSLFVSSMQARQTTPSPSVHNS